MITLARVACLALLLAATSEAAAHTLSVAHVDVQRSASGEPLAIELDLSVRDLALTLPIDANQDERVSWGELRLAQPLVESMVRAGVEVRRGSAACAMTLDAYGVRQYDDGAYASLRFSLRCPTTGGPASLVYRLFFERDPQHRGLIAIRDGAASTTAIASPSRPVVALGITGRGPFLDFLREGLHHILIGYDHLAFLLALLLPAVLVRRDGRWQGVESPKQALLHITGIVTAFTVAHSISLTAAALGWVTPASRWVESAIALSVLLAALNNVWPKVTRRHWAVGFVFGLVHGFGFAGALSELGLPTGARVVSLLGFNLGVEAGQLAVVCLVLPVLLAARRRAAYARAVMPAISLVLAALAAWWLVQRLGG